MSGHSKWATIHRSKEVKDAQRGAIFTKLGRAISIAVHQGRGVDEAVDRARRFNMPKENITRAIERAAGGDADQLEETTFEGFLPGGATVMIQSLTDNRLRTTQQVREILDRGGGRLAGQGAVGYLFRQLGEIVALPTSKSVEEAELEIIDLGVEDVDIEEGKLIIHTGFDKTFEVKKQLEGLGYQVVSADLIMHPTTLVQVTVDVQAKIEVILEKLDDLDDVQKVWSNYE